MRFAASACFALVLLAGNTGCCLFCHPMFPLLHRHCQSECCGMGCQRAPIFNWGRCCDPCDHCGDWAGQSIIARTGGNSQTAQYTGARPARARATTAGRVVPGTYREVTRVDEPVSEVSEEEVVDQEMADEEPQVVVEAPRAKRIRSSKPTARQVVRVQRVE